MKKGVWGRPLGVESLTGEQRQQLGRLVEEWLEWNQRINLISRRDTDHLWERHIDPVLVFPGYFHLTEGSTVLDLGTGGGIPGLILAILYPKVHFCLLDSVGKKVAAVEAIRRSLGLKQVTTHWGRVETLDRRFDFVVGRAVAALPKFLGWANRCLRKGTPAGPAAGVFYWKGGDPEVDAHELGEPAATVIHFGIGPEESDEGKYLAFYSHDQVRTILAKATPGPGR